jgi:DNA polymerase sigma
MSDSVDAIASLATRIAEIRNRLRELETERTALRIELDDCTASFTSMTTGIYQPRDGSSQIDLAILRHFRQHPETFFTSADIESALRKKNWSNIDGAYLRTKLSRLARRGLIRRVGYGRYMDKGA